MPGQSSLIHFCTAEVLLSAVSFALSAAVGCLSASASTLHRRDTLYFCRPCGLHMPQRHKDPHACGAAEAIAE